MMVLRLLFMVDLESRLRLCGGFRAECARITLDTGPKEFLAPQLVWYLPCVERVPTAGDSYGHRVLRTDVPALHLRVQTANMMILPLLYNSSLLLLLTPVSPRFGV